MIRVLFVDDDQRLRESWTRMFERISDILLVGTCDRADEVPAAARNHDADIVVMDLTMPGRDPLEVCREMSQGQGRARVVFYSGLDDPALTEAAYDAGAWGFVDKLSPPEAIMNVIRDVAGGTPAFPPRSQNVEVRPSSGRMQT